MPIKDTTKFWLMAWEHGVQTHNFSAYEPLMELYGEPTTPLQAFTSDRAASSAGRSKTPTGLPENPTKADGTSGWAIGNTALSARKCEELSGIPGRYARKKRRARRKFGLFSWKFRELWPSWREIARAFPSFALFIPEPSFGCRRCRD